MGFGNWLYTGGGGRKENVTNFYRVVNVFGENNSIFFVEVEFTYNIMLISCVQHNDSIFVFIEKMIATIS